MRHDRIPLIDGDEYDVFLFDRGIRSVDDSGFRKTKAAVKKAYNKRARRLGKPTNHNTEEN
jgi:hypothetical protein